MSEDGWPDLLSESIKTCKKSTQMSQGWLQPCNEQYPCEFHQGMKAGLDRAWFEVTY